MHELSSNNPDLARQVFCILLGYGTLSCQAGSLPHATWVLMFLSGNRARGSHFSPLKQNAIYSLCAHSGDSPVGYPEGNAFIVYPWEWEVSPGLPFCTLTSAREALSHAGSVCKGGTSQTCTLSWLHGSKCAPESNTSIPDPAMTNALTALLSLFSSAQGLYCAAHMHLLVSWL